MTKGKLILVTGLLFIIGVVYWAWRYSRESQPTRVAEVGSTEIPLVPATQEAPIPTFSQQSEINSRLFSSPAVPKVNEASPATNDNPLPRVEHWPPPATQVQAPTLSTQKSEQQEIPEVKPVQLTNLFETPIGNSPKVPPVEIYLLGRTNINGQPFVIFRVVNISSTDYSLTFQSKAWNGVGWTVDWPRMEPNRGGTQHADAGMEAVFGIRPPANAAIWKLTVRYINVATRQEDGAFYTSTIQETNFNGKVCLLLFDGCWALLNNNLDLSASD